MSAPKMQNSPMPKNRDSVEQDQFLTILSREDALAHFEAALFPRAIPGAIIQEVLPAAVLPAPCPSCC